MPARQIVNGLYCIATGAINTFYLDDPAGGILIDTGYPDTAPKILAALAAINRRPHDVRHILLTHAHPDHIGSAAALQRLTGAQTWMHPADAPIATSGTGFRPLTPAPGLQKKLLFKAFVPHIPRVDPVTIDHAIHDGDTLPLAGGLTAVHTPGHCAGQLAFLWKRHGGVLFAADNCMNLFSLDLSICYEDLALGKQSLQKLSTLDFTLACFGHGTPLRRDAAGIFRRKWSSPATSI